MKYLQLPPQLLPASSTPDRRVTRSISSAFNHNSSDAKMKKLPEVDMMDSESDNQQRRIPSIKITRSKPKPKITKAGVKGKRPGRFRVAYTNRKAIKVLSESGNNELSMDSMSFLTDDEKLLLSSWGLPSPVLSVIDSMIRSNNYVLTF
jgi:hypothetical protein